MFSVYSSKSLLSRANMDIITNYAIKLLLYNIKQAELTINTLYVAIGR